jgi:hypothetical protein
MSPASTPASAVRWWELKDAFGFATHLPALLAAVSEARGAKLHRKMRELCERVLHQGTIFSASPPAVQALIGMAAGAAGREKTVFYEVLCEFAVSARKAIRDGRAIPCCSGGEPADGAAILGHILQARARFAPDLEHRNAAIRGLAGELLAASAEADPEAAKLVRDRYLAEPESAVRFRLLDGLARVRGSFADWREFLDAALHSERDPDCRFSLRRAQIREMGSGAEPAVVDELVATFLRTSASDFPPHCEAFFDAVQLLGRERELAALKLAFDGAAHRGPARLLAKRLLRIAFDDRRTGWGQTSFSYVAERNLRRPAPKDPRKALLKGVFKLVGMTILWKLFPFLRRRRMRQMEQANRKRTRKIDYWGLEGAAPEIPAKLTDEQRSILTAFAEKPVLWEFRTNLWDLFGLPASADDMRRFVADRA